MKTEDNTLMIMLTEASLQGILERALAPVKEKMERLENLLSESGEMHPLADYVSTKIAAEMLGLTQRTVRQYQNDGKLTSYKQENGKGHVFSRVDVVKLSKRLP